MTDINQLAKENEELKHQNAIKSDLISISAHQLRTSLAAVKWILKMLLDGDLGALTPEQNNLMKKAFDSDERMIKLVNEMLSINHAEDTLESKHVEPTDIVALLDETVFDFIGESHKRGIELVFLKPSTPLAPIALDPEKARVVFQNLIENAIKYSGTSDRVLINMTDSPEEVQISVRDTGIGIPEEDQARIFGKFFRAENARKQESIGSGLGLYTTKRIMEKHGGKIWFESSPAGTTFFVSFPRTQTGGTA
jgi:signal transduction histidine kinase